MHLIYVAYVAQAVNSIAVVISLVFVGIQIRRSAQGTRAASHHAITEAINHLNLVWARDGELSRIWLAGLNDRQELSPEDRWRFDSVLRAYLHVCETMYTQAGFGAGDAGIVAAEEAGLKHVFKSAGVREWWSENPFGLAPGFRRYVERLVGYGRDDTTV